MWRVKHPYSFPFPLFTSEGGDGGGRCFLALVTRASSYQQTPAALCIPSGVSDFPQTAPMVLLYVISSTVFAWSLRTV